MSESHPRNEPAYRSFASPLGWLLLAAGSEGLCVVHFCGSIMPSRESCQTLLKEGSSHHGPTFSPDHPLLRQAEEAILAYIRYGRPLPTFPLDVRAGTPFQREVWQVLRQIPFGETRSYGEVARSAGRPQAPRAVGRACGRNPLPLFIPCHRVIAADGSLGGFSSGLELKRALLSLEQGQGFADQHPGGAPFVPITEAER